MRSAATADLVAVPVDREHPAQLGVVATESKLQREVSSDSMISFLPPEPLSYLLSANREATVSSPTPGRDWDHKNGHQP
jgi:hypothetical protein